MLGFLFFFFFFKQKTAYEMRISDWSSDVCSSDLLIHGMSDDNVVFDHAAAVIAELQATDTPFDMMLYPGQTHRIAGPERQTHMWRTLERFLDRTHRATAGECRDLGW